MSQSDVSEATVDFSPAAEPLAELLEPARAIIARYPVGHERSALLPLLHLVQTEEGFVSPRGVAFCAEVLGITKAQVGAVATFYTMYKRRPTGEYLVSVCTNTLCNVMGGQEVYDGLVEHLGVGHDETTGDGKITLEHAECLAACDYAPVVTVNYDFAIDQATPEQAVDMVDRLAAGERPMPSRGARLCSLKEMSMQLAGFPDAREGTLADGAAGLPTLRGVTLAQEHGVAVADFNPDTPIAKTKPSPREERAAESKPSKVGTAARKAVSAVKSAAASVTNKDEPAPAPAGDVKDPQVRTAEKRNRTASTPGEPATPTGGPPPSTPGAQAAEAEGVAQNAPAGDGKPAGDVRPAAADEEKK